MVALALIAEGVVECVPMAIGSAVGHLVGYGAGDIELLKNEAKLAPYGHVALIFFCLTKRSKTQAQINALPALPALAKFLYKRVPNHVCGIYARLAFTTAHPRPPDSYRDWAGPRTRVLQTRWVIGFLRCGGVWGHFFALNNKGRIFCAECDAVFIIS